MFKFNLPKWSAMHVNLPTGGATTMIHIGNGEFLSSSPPVCIVAASPEPVASNVEPDLPLTWDGTTMPAGATLNSVLYSFATAGAEKQVREAAAAGDVMAQGVVDALERAAAALEADEARAAHEARAAGGSL